MPSQKRGHDRRTSGRRPEHPRYQVVGRLGSGGMGAVWLARDRCDGGREVAFKVSHPGTEPEHLLREFRILRRIHHGGIVRGLDFGRLRDGRTYLALEYIAGPNLEEASGELRSEFRVGHRAPLYSVFLEVAAALDCLHRQGLLHLDLKPSNVVLVDGQARLIDLGFFQNLRDQDVHRLQGTPQYAAPEVLEGHPVDCRADLYSLGATFYRALTGEFPIPGRTRAELAENHRRFSPASPAGAPEELCRIVLKLLAKAPERRFESAREVCEALCSLEDPPRIEPAEVALEEPELAGRERELDVFFRWLERIRRREGPRALRVRGGPESGKSRFLEVCETEMLAIGTRVVRVPAGRSAHGSGLRRLVEHLSVLFAFGRGIRERCRFLFDHVGISKRPATREEASGLDIGRLRWRLASELSECLRSVSEEPLVLLLDDLHLADPEFAGIVRCLAEPSAALGASPDLGIVASSRPDPAIDETAGPPHVETVELEPLKRADLLKSLRAARPVLGDAVLAQIASLSEGNPGRLSRLLASALARSGEDRLEGVASTLGEFLVARIRSLTEEDRMLLLHVGLFRRSVPESVVARLSGAAGAALRRGLRRLERSGLLRGDERGWTLSQDVSRQELVEGLDVEAVRRVEEGIARRLLEDPRQVPYAAVHLLRCGRADEGVELARRAWRELSDRGQLEEAIDLLDEALEHAPAGSVRFEILEAQGDCFLKSGRFERAAAAFDALLDADDLSAAVRARILRKRGSVHQRVGASEAARRTFEEALRRHEDDGELDERLHLLHELAALHLFLGDFERSMAYARRGLELLASGADPELSPAAVAYHAINLHSVAGNVLLRQFEFDRAIDELSLGLEFCKKAGALSNTALILNNLGLAYRQSSRLSQALVVYSRAMKLAARLADETTLFSIRCNLAAVHARQGRFSEALAMLESVEAMADLRASGRARLFLRYTRGLVEHLIERDPRRVWEESIRLAEELSDPQFASYGRVYLLENHVLHGRWKDARAVLDGLGAAAGLDERLERAVRVRRLHLDALAGRRLDALRLLDEELGAGRPPLEEGRRPHDRELWDAVALASGMLELGELEEAERRFTTAMEWFERLKEPPGVLRSALSLAELRLRRRDAAGARTALEAARAALPGEGVLSSSLIPARLSFLSARLEHLRGGDGREILDLLLGAREKLPFGKARELAWLVDLTAEECGDPDAGERLEASRARFLEGLLPEDRRSYCEQDHRRRLGLVEGPAREGAGDAREGSARRRLDALSALRRAKGPAHGLRLVLSALGAPGGAMRLRSGNPRFVASGLEREEEERLAAEADWSGIGDAEGGSWILRELCLPGGKPFGTLLVKRAPAAGSAREIGEAERFLELAGLVLSGVLAELAASEERAGSSPVTDDTRTRSLPVNRLVTSKSRPMQDVLALVQKARDASLPLLLAGESGTGKDFLAHWIHRLSPRSDAPFLALNCATAHEGLLEADLFGYEAGAFTGAQKARQGCLEATSGGTLYLDNVDCLPLDAQAVLLRAIEEGEVRRIGGTNVVRVDVRFIASTQGDLEALSRRGEFRRDLYFRLAGIRIAIPPLRLRNEDIPLLVEHFRRQLPGGGPPWAREAIDALIAYSWPGNVRELETLVRRIAITVEGRVRRDDIARALGSDGAAGSVPRWIFEGRSYEDLLRDVRREFLLYLHERCEGDFDRIAKELGTTRRNAYLRFARAGLRIAELRSAEPGSSGGGPER